MENMFKPSEVTKDFYHDSIPSSNRGKCFSIKDMGLRTSKMYVNDAKVHDANFAFLSTSLAKLHNTLYEPKYFVTYTRDIDIDVGGGFVDYVEFYTVDWAGIMNEFRNVMGNNANYVPRVNAGLTQKKVNVYTFEVAYDLRFIELEKMNKLTLQKSIQDIYNNAIVAGWDLFVQKVAYTGIKGETGLFNNADSVHISTIDNADTTGNGFEGMTDDSVVAFFNGVFNYYLINSGMNISLLPNKFLVPSFVSADLLSRFSALYTSTLYDFLLEHNLGKAQSSGEVKITIEARSELDTLGTGNHGRIVAYRKEKDFLRLDMPYPMQHYITLPNMDKFAYTSAFVGQVSQIQMPYNTSKEELGPVTYWDFTTAK